MDEDSGYCKGDRFLTSYKSGIEIENFDYIDCKKKNTEFF